MLTFNRFQDHYKPLSEGGSVAFQRVDGRIAGFFQRGEIRLVHAHAFGNLLQAQAGLFTCLA